VLADSPPVHCVDQFDRLTNLGPLFEGAFFRTIIVDNLRRHAAQTQTGCGPAGI